jgi:hypothetical protein
MKEITDLIEEKKREDLIEKGKNCRKKHSTARQILVLNR